MNGVSYGQMKPLVKAGKKPICNSCSIYKIHQVSNTFKYVLFIRRLTVMPWKIRKYLHFKRSTKQCDLLFNICLKLGDGCIDLDEFVSVCTSFGISGDESRKAFETISQVSSKTGTFARFAFYSPELSSISAFAL